MISLAFCSVFQASLSFPFSEEGNKSYLHYFPRRSCVAHHFAIDATQRKDSSGNPEPWHRRRVVPTLQDLLYNSKKAITHLA